MLGLAGIGAGGLIGTRFLGSPDLGAGARPESDADAMAPCADLDRLLSLPGGASGQARALDFLVRAIEQAPDLYGRRSLLEARWDEGRQLWDAVTTDSTGPDLALIVGPSQTEATELLPLTPVPPPPLADFLADEAALLEAWSDVGPDGLDGFDPGVEDMTRRLVAKLLAAAGLKEAAQAILNILDGAGYLWLLGQAIDERNGRLLLELIEEVLDFLLSRKFLSELAEEVGERQARRLVGGIAGRFLPALGWALFITQLIWAFAEQVDLEWFRDLLDGGESEP